MVDTNDPGWPYLRLSPEVQLRVCTNFAGKFNSAALLAQKNSQTLQEQAARKFDNKTHYWVPDPTEGFIIGKVESEADNKVTLTLPDGTPVCNLNKFVK